MQKVEADQRREERVLEVMGSYKENKRTRGPNLEKRRIVGLRKINKETKKKEIKRKIW
jgi:hypothetical protein